MTGRDGDSKRGFHAEVTRPSYLPHMKFKAHVREFAHYDIPESDLPTPLEGEDGPYIYPHSERISFDRVGEPFEVDLFVTYTDPRTLAEPDRSMWDWRLGVLDDVLGNVPGDTVPLRGLPIFDDCFETYHVYEADFVWDRFEELYGPFDTPNFDEEVSP